MFNCFANQSMEYGKIDNIRIIIAPNIHQKLALIDNFLFLTPIIM